MMLIVLLLDQWLKHGSGKIFDMSDAGYPVPKYMKRADVTKIVNTFVSNVSKM